MKIGILNWRDIKNPLSGGAEIYLHEQAKIWIKNGNEVIWFTSKTKSQPSNEIIDGIKFIRMGNKLTVYLFAPIIYLRKFKNIDFLIDAENGIPFFSPIYSKKKKILLIHHIHKDVWFKEFNFPLNWLGYFLETNIMPLVYKNTKIITVSNSSKKEIRKLMKNNSINIVYNGLNKSYSPGEKSRNNEIIFVGRLKKYKSVEVLLKAVSLLNKNIIINIIGQGDDNKRLRKIAKNLNIKNINFLGFISEKEKIKLLQRATVSVNPSFVEGWSITNIEANACGTIVIGSNVNGIIDSIKDKQTGLLFRYGDYKDLAEKLKFILENKIIRENLEKNALTFSKKFCWEKSANKLFKILN